MTFEIHVNGRMRTVTVERIGAGRFEITIDGRSREVDARPLGDSTFSLIVPATGCTLDVSLSPTGRPGEFVAASRAGSCLVALDGRRAAAASRTPGAGREGAQRVMAPMPGRVVRVLVGPGDAVAARQGLVVMEAMKMENELSAPRAGRVAEVAVREGMSVEAGRLLVVVE